MSKIIVDDSTFEGKDDPTQYSSEDNVIYVKSSYDVKGDPEGWMSHEFKHVKLRDMVDDGKEYPFNNIEEEAYKSQFKFLLSRGYNLGDIKEFPTLGIKFRNYGGIFSRYWEEVVKSFYK